MKKYLKYLFTCFSAAVFITASSPTKSSEEWRTDYKKALEQAVVERKKVLLNFTGSDWCRWCIRFKEEVFDRPEFVQFAKKHLAAQDRGVRRERREVGGSLAGWE
ncbi:MAG: thioredoxin family protein [Candidatus Xiphinematobacter sp.]|nr:MAG: thioredoxin family protein [Candidatus Xiphinematobacter sp.]